MSGDTQRLIERCIRREEKAWEEFVKRFSGLLYYSARERLKRNGISFIQHDLDDIVQAVFAELLEHERLNEVKNRQKIGAWLSIVAQTRALNYMVRKKERLLREEEFYRIENIKAHSSPPASERLLQKMEELIKELAPKEKIILKMSIFHKKTHKEIARFMKMPANTVSTIVARRKRALEEKLKKFLDE